MKKIELFSFLILIYSTIDANGHLFKHLTPRPGGIIDSLTKPLQPGGFQLGSNLGGGMSFGLGSFGFNLGFNKQYVPGGANRPPKDPHIPDGGTGYPDGNPYVPGVKPGYPEDNPYVPGVKPGYPDGNPYVPGVKPGYPDENPYVPKPKPVRPENPVVKPGMTWEDEEDKISSGYPSKDKDNSKPEAYEKDYPKREDKRPDWEDIGEDYEKDSKSENYMDKDLVGEGLIQPRQKQKRNKRFIESKIYHVPLLFRSNAKPSKVKIHNSLNDLDKISAQ